MMEELAKRVAVALMSKNYTMATIEECTCGLIGAAVASQDYAQRWYKGTIVPFTEEIAKSLMEVPEYTIRRNDFVSSQVASNLALNGLYKFNVNICTAVVGYVDGYGSTDIPAGEVQICVAKLVGKEVRFAYHKVKVKGDDRGKNIEVAMEEALKLTLKHIIDD